MSPHPCPPAYRRVPALLPLGLVALAVLLVPAGTLRAGEPATERFEKTYDLTGITKVRLQNVNGSVRLATVDRPTAHVVAVKKARGSNAEEILRDTEIRVVKAGTVLDIETILPRQRRFLGFFHWGSDPAAEVAYELELPGTLPVDVETVNGRVSAERRTAPLTLNTVNGSVRVEGHDAPVQVNTVNGSVEVSFAGAFHASKLETVNGSVTVACDRDSSIQFDLQTVNGGIRSDFPEVIPEGKWGPKEARGAIGGGRERLSVETVNGEVRLVVGSPRGDAAR